MVGLAGAGVMLAFWQSNQWSSMGLIRFTSGDELFCNSLTLDSVGVSCQGPAFRGNFKPALPLDFGSRYTWPWALVDHIERTRASALVSEPTWLRWLLYAIEYLLSVLCVLVPLFMLRALVRFVRGVTPES
jgi:hypothetical protein